MSWKMEFAFYALWIAHPALQFVLAGFMVRRKLHRRFHWFFVYLISQVVIFTLLFPVYLKSDKSISYYELFFYLFWALDAVSLALGFKVIHEIFLDVFQPYHTLKDLGTVLFKWAGLVMLMVAAVVAAANSASDQDPLVQSVLTVQRCVRVIQCGLILFLLLFSRYLGVSRKQHSFGIAAGFGLFANAELLVVALRAGAYISQNAANLANMMAYNLAILLWLSYMVTKGAARASSATLLTSQRWDQSLSELHHPVGDESLIPMFEGMVERAFSRAHETQDSEETDRLKKTAESQGVSEETSGLAQSASASQGASSKR